MKTFVKASVDYKDQLTKGETYEILSIIYNGVFRSGKGIVLQNDVDDVAGYDDEGYFE